MTAHPNAHILAQLAEIAKTDPEPWKRLERYGSAGWITCNDHTPVLNPDVVLRIKPATVNIGGVELEGPLREAPEEVQKLRKTLIECKRQAASMRIWNGTGWTYHPPQAKQIFDAAEAALSTLKTESKP